MGAVVRKSSPVLVRPSEHVTMTGNVKLSPYDEMFVGSANTALLVFATGPMDAPAERIKKALSQALVHYPLIAGRFVRAADSGELACDHIACTSEGVLFVAATASASVEDVKYFNSSMPTTQLLDDLAVYYPAEGCGPNDPLLLMQVTEFSCGGFVVGITKNHAATDGLGLGQFTQAIGELARGLSAPSVVPAMCDDSLKALPPLMQAYRRVFESLAPCPELALLDMTISGDLINRIRDASSAGTGRRCTVFEAVTALLWKCRARAIMSDPEATTILSISMNARRYVGATEGYYRNCIIVQLAVAKSGVVADGPITDLVKLIQRAKDQLPHMLQTQSLDLEQEKLHAYDLCLVTYWRHIGLDDADFGGGKPAKVLSYRKSRGGFPSNIITANGMDDGGCNVLSRTVKNKHADTFLHELASLAI